MADRLRVIALTGGSTVPSARFRVEQMMPALRRAGVDLDWRPARVSGYPPVRRWLRPLWLPAAVLARVPDVVATHRAQVTLFSREFVSTLATLEFVAARPRVFDVDDAIWLHKGGGFARRLARAMDVVIAGNAYLADWFGRYCDRVEIVPTVVDTARFVPAAPGGAGSRSPAVGWIGSSANFDYLLLWQDALLDVMTRVPDLRVRVCADRRPPLDALPPGRVDWVPWHSAAEVPFLQSLDIGLMPLADSQWARGKCSYKMLLYLACGVPAVVSPVGMNRDVLAAATVGRAAGDPGEAAAALLELLGDDHGRAALGRAGRQLVVERYSVDVLAPRLADILRQAAGQQGGD